LALLFGWLRLERSTRRGAGNSVLATY